MFHKNLLNNILQKPPIVWVEATHDTVLSHEEKSSYQELVKEGITVDYIKDDTSDHDFISLAAVHKVADAVKKYIK